MKKNVALTKEDKKILCVLKKHKDSYKSVLFSGVACLILGIALQLSRMIRYKEYMFFEGIFFITIGVILIPI